MTDAAAETRTVVVEREIPYAPEKIWRALTEPHLIEEWLMKNDFEPTVDHKFNLRGDWGAVDCQVLKIQPMRTLSYSWGAHGLESVVTWGCPGRQNGQSTPPVARPNATSPWVSTGAPQWAHWSSAGMSTSSRRQASSNLRTLRVRNSGSPRCRKVVLAASNSLGCGS